MTTPRLTPTLVLRVLMALGFAVCPLLRPTVGVAAPVLASSEEEERPEENRGSSEAEGEQWAARGDRRADRPTARSVADPVPLPSASARPAPPLPRAATVDPFRNGLGSPYRC